MSTMQYKVSGVKVFASGMTVALMFVHQAVVCAEDMHVHHHHMAEPKTIVRTLAYYEVPAVKLVNSEGKESLLPEIISAEKPVMLNFIFTTCTAICPIMSSSFSQVSTQLGNKYKELQLISISIDPEQDTPAKLREYAKQFAGGPQWHLFTGTLDNSIAVQKAFDSYRGGKMNHLPLTFLRGANSNQWVRIEGLSSSEELIQELNKLPVH